MYETIDSTQKQCYYVPTTEQRQQDAVKQHPATDRRRVRRQENEQAFGKTVDRTNVLV